MLKMKSSKYTQASTPNDNDYQNVGVTILQDDSNQNPEGRSSEYLLYKRPEVAHQIEQNANRFPVDIELCNCPTNESYVPKTRFLSDQNIGVNRSFNTLPKYESTNLSQYSLDRKIGMYQKRAKTAYQCPRITAPRIQSPEIINIHRGPNTVLFENHPEGNCAVKPCSYDKDSKCDDYGFRRGHPFRTSSRFVKKMCRIFFL